MGSLEEHKEHGEERGEITRGNTQEQVQITHSLDNQTHKITRYMNNQRETRYMVEFIPNPMKEMRA